MLRMEAHRCVRSIGDKSMQQYSFIFGTQSGDKFLVNEVFKGVVDLFVLCWLECQKDFLEICII